MLSIAQCLLHVPRSGSAARRPPSLLTGSLGLVSLLSIATMGALRLPPPISRAFALNSALDTSVCPASFADNGPDRPSSLDLGNPVWSLPGVVRGDGRPSQLPWRPHRRSALLSDPGGTLVPDRCGTSVLPPLSQTRRLPRSTLFRGSITRLHGSLSTLEGGPLRPPTKTRFVGGWSVLARRDGSRGVSIEAFRCSFHLVPFGCVFCFPFFGSSTIPASQGLGWRHVNESVGTPVVFGARPPRSDGIPAVGAPVRGLRPRRAHGRMPCLLDPVAHTFIHTHYGSCLKMNLPSRGTANE